MNEKDSILYISIVAIVAIVGMIVMISTTSNQKTYENTPSNTLLGQSTETSLIDDEPVGGPYITCKTCYSRFGRNLGCSCSLTDCTDEKCGWLGGCYLGNPICGYR
jgi:hypothetical protein